MNILALDLGTETGFAFNLDSRFETGTWRLATAQQIRAFRTHRLHRRGDPRIFKLKERINDLLVLPVELIVFEDVEFSGYTYQAQLWPSFRTVVWLAANEQKIPVECVSVKTLKKFATGHGGATKNMMRSALWTEEGTRKKNIMDASLDDNAIDAFWIWKWAQQNLCRINQTSIGQL